MTGSPTRSQSVEPLRGLVVVMLAHVFVNPAGRLLAEAGADVIIVYPSDTDRLADEDRASRDDARQTVIDIASAEGRRQFRELVSSADVLLEAEDPDRLATLGIDYGDLTRQSLSGVVDTTPGPPPVNDQLLHVSVTPLGRTRRVASGIMPTSPERSSIAATNLTLLARGGAVWLSGGEQLAEAPAMLEGVRVAEMAAQVAVSGLLTALLARDTNGSQFVDVSMLAAVNLALGRSTTSWLVAQEATDRHSLAKVRASRQVLCADGGTVVVGSWPRRSSEFVAIGRWLEKLDESAGDGSDEFTKFESASLLELGSEYEELTPSMIESDEQAGAVYSAGMTVVRFLAERLSAEELFEGLQACGLDAAPLRSVAEALEGPAPRPIRIRSLA